MKWKLRKSDGKRKLRLKILELVDQGKTPKAIANELSTDTNFVNRTITWRKARPCASARSQECFSPNAGQRMQPTGELNG